MAERDSLIDPALQAANLALVGSQREASRFAAIELRFSDPDHGPWEIAAIVSVGFAAIVAVIGLWFA